MRLRRPRLNKVAKPAPVPETPQIDPRIGYDGNPPVFAKTKGTRAQESSPQNLNVDRLQWLYEHRLIDEAQHIAGKAFQKFYLTAQIGMNGSSTELSSRGPDLLADRRLDAMQQFGKAHDALKMWPAHWAMLDLCILRDCGLADAAHTLKRPQKWALPAIRDALDVLAKIYGFAA